MPTEPSNLTLARRQLAEALGCPEAIPDVIDAPCLAIQPADPYLDGAEKAYGQLEVRQRMEVFAFVDLDDNAIAAAQLDDLIITVVAQAAAAGWGVNQIGQPGPHTNGDWLHHGVQIVVSRIVSL